MSSLIAFIKAYIHIVLLRKKFPTSVIYPGASADKACILDEYSVLFRGVNLIDSTLGAHSYIQSGSVVCNTDISKFCSIASDVNIGLQDHPMHMVSTSPVFYDNSQPLPRFLTNNCTFTQASPRTTIGADVWIGQGAIIKAGIKIGVGAVIGAGAVVTKDVSAYVITAGNPSKQIRLRFSEDIISRLVESKWWALNDKKLAELSYLFVDPLKLLDELER